MHCPNCGAENQTGYKFCMRCGNPLPSEVPVEMTHTPPRPPTPVSMPGYPEQSTYPMNAQPYGSGQTYYPVVGTSLSALNIWGPFAGYGTRRRHVGWLMDGCANRVEELKQCINVKFSDRQIPGAVIQPETLIAKGVFIETRPYIILKRGLVSLALNIVEFGKDLFISLASYLKPPISNFRVIVICTMILIWLFSTFILPGLILASVESSVSGFSLLGGSRADASGSLVFLFCILGPFATVNNIALFVFLLYSIYKWLTEKDFLAGLRSAPNEFNEDDLMALEKSVEQTVRIALDEIGLNPNDLKPVEGTAGRRII